MKHEHNHSHVENEGISFFEKIMTIMGVIILVLTLILDKFLFSSDKLLILCLYIAAYIMISYQIIINGIKNIFKFRALDENFLMTVATVGAIILGEYFEAAMVILLYKLGEFLQDLAVDRSTKKIGEAIDIREEHANLKLEDSIKIINSEDLKIGDIIVVKNGEKVPVDGIVYKGSTNIDNSLVTGESLPLKISEGERILSGSINIGEVIEIKVEKEYSESTVSKIVDFIEKAGKNKSKTEKFITRFAKIYTPVVIIIAILIMIFVPIFFDLEIKEAISRGLIFLVISCPCALVISIPLGFFIGIGECSKKGIIVKGSNYLDILSNTNIMAFDKTGTLTKGNFRISKIVNKSNISDEEFIDIISHAEYYSNHYIAKSILKDYKGKIDKNIISNYNEVAGKGIKVNIKSKSVIVGTKEFLEENGIKLDKEEKEKVGTIIYLAIDNVYKGCIILLDELKENSTYTIGKLNKLKVKTLLLTGDHNSVASIIAEKLNIIKFYSDLLPEDKVLKIEEIKKEGEIVTFVGDGINDSPVIAASNVGISMGKGADISVEVADIVIMNDDPKSIIDALNISKRTKIVIKQNIVFALVIKILFLILSSFGLTNMWLAIFADVGVALLTVLNSFRIKTK